MNTILGLNMNTRLGVNMNLPVSLVLFGNSGCGKDTLANIFVEAGYKRLHPIADLKSFLANLLNYPVSVFDTAEGKMLENRLPYVKTETITSSCADFVASHYYYTKLSQDEKDVIADKIAETLIALRHVETIGDIMREMYFLFAEFDNQFSLPYLERFFIENARYNKVLLGIRNRHEVDFLVQERIKHKHRNYVVWIDRPGYDGYSTDHQQRLLYDYYSAHCHLNNVGRLINNHSLLDWKRTAVGLYHLIYNEEPIIGYRGVGN